MYRSNRVSTKPLTVLATYELELWRSNRHLVVNHSLIADRPHSRFEDQRAIRIAGTRGFNYGDHFRTAAADGLLDVHWTDTTSEAFRKLLAGDVALVAHDQGVGHEDLRTHFTASESRGVTYHPRMTDHHLSNVIFPRANLQRSVLLRDAFDEGLAEATASGEVQRWVDDFKHGRYGNAPFEGDYWTLENPLVAEP